MATEPNLLKRFACFEHLTEEQVKAVAEITNSVCYMKGHALFQEGDAAQWLYLLIDGDVGVYYKNPETGDSQVDAVSSEEVLGCSGLIPPYQYTATERCLVDVEVLEINMKDLRDLIHEDPQVGLKLQEYIIQTLNKRILKLRHRALS
jgi:CRP-like cAMP-binding protein